MAMVISLSLSPRQFEIQKENPRSYNKHYINDEHRTNYRFLIYLQHFHQHGDRPHYAESHDEGVADNLYSAFMHGASPIVRNNPADGGRQVRPAKDQPITVQSRQFIAVTKAIRYAPRFTGGA